MQPCAHRIRQRRFTDCSYEWVKAMGSTLRAASLNLSAQPRPAPFPLPFAVLFRLWRQSPPLPLLGPRSHPLGFLRLPLNPLVPSRAERHSIAPLQEATGQFVKPGLVLAPDAGHGHASAAAGGARRILHAFLAKPLAGCGHKPVQLVGDTRIGAAFAPCGGDQLLAPRNFLGSLSAVRLKAEQIQLVGRCLGKRGKSVGTQVARDVKASDRLGIRKRLCARRPFRQGVVAL
jgi:hypothetical protein